MDARNITTPMLYNWPSTSRAAAARNQPKENQYFPNDQIVFVNENALEFGEIIETYSSDRNDDYQVLKPGEVRFNLCGSRQEQVRSGNTIALVNRPLKQGDFVRRINSNWLGYVCNVKVTADISPLESQQVIKNVAVDRLRPLNVWKPGCTVCLNSWIGNIKDVDERAVLIGSNGVIFEIRADDFHNFFEESTLLRPAAFFAGNIVYGRLPTLDKAKILTPDIPVLLDIDGDMLRAKFFVESVRTEAIYVQWLSKAGASEKQIQEKPSSYVNAEQFVNVKRLDVVEFRDFQLTSRNFFTYEPLKDLLLAKAEWDKEIENRFRKLFSQQNCLVSPDCAAKQPTTKCAKMCTDEKLNELATKTVATKEASIETGEELIIETLLVCSTVSVIWQNGIIEDNIPTTQLYPINFLHTQEFFPGDIIKLNDASIAHDYGVVQAVNSHSLMTLIKWFKKYSQENNVGDPKYQGETQVSFSELTHHPDFNYLPRCTVKRVSNFENTQYTAGQVLQNCIDGRIKVIWDNGQISSCYPQDLFHIGIHEDHDYRVGKAKRQREVFKTLSNVPSYHVFLRNLCEPSQQYLRAVQREQSILRTSLPRGIWIRFYEDRIDLLSIMIEGPKGTPYENGLFFFDIHLARDYPKKPPLCHYINYCNAGRLNPNLYENGRVCVSLLGTWSGSGVEVWNEKSTLLQLLVSIQGLILVPDPYFNEPGTLKGSIRAYEASCRYNAIVVANVMKATIEMLQNPPSIFKDEIIEYYKENGLVMCERLQGWVELSKLNNAGNDQTASRTKFAEPDFSLISKTLGANSLSLPIKELKDMMYSILKYKNN